MNDLVSIIMPSYNTGRFIAKTIESVLAQTYPDWELIIVDDCSTDDTDVVVAAFSDPRIRYLKNEKNSGAAISRNRALREAKGRWIAFLDSDDLWLPEKLEKQIRFMEDNSYGFTYTDYAIVTPEGTLQPYIYTAPKYITKWMMYNYCYFSTITVIYDTKIVGTIQIEDVKKNNDYAMWFEAIKYTVCYRYPECMSIYCKRNGSISSGNKIKLIKFHYILYRKALKMGKLASSVQTIRNLIFGVLRKVFYKKKIKENSEEYVTLSTAYQ